MPRFVEGAAGAAQQASKRNGGAGGEARAPSMSSRSSQRAYGDGAHALILTAAQELFARRGLEAVSMDDIARTAKVSRASVFNHFRTKRLLLDAITARSLAAYRDLLSSALDDDETPTPVLLSRLFVSMARGLEANRDLYREVFTEIRKVSMGLDGEGLSPGLRQEAFALLTAIFERGRRRGDITLANSAEALATAYDSLLSGAVAWWLHGSPGQPLAPLLGEMVEIFLTGVRPSDPSPLTRG